MAPPAGRPPKDRFERRSGRTVRYNYFKTLEARAQQGPVEGSRDRPPRVEGRSSDSDRSRTKKKSMDTMLTSASEASVLATSVRPVGPIGATLAKSSRSRRSKKSKGYDYNPTRLYDDASEKIRERARKKVQRRREAERVHDDYNHHVEVLKKEMEELDDNKKEYYARKKKARAEVLKRGHKYARVIQAFYRPLLEKKHAGAKKIQARARGRLVRKERAAVAIQCATRQRFARAKVSRGRSAVKIQSVARSRRARKTYGRKLEARRALVWAQKRKAARNIQRVVRGNASRRNVNKMRAAARAKKSAASSKAQQRLRGTAPSKKSPRLSQRGGTLEFMPSLRKSAQARGSKDWRHAVINLFEAFERSDKGSVSSCDHGFDDAPGVASDGDGSDIDDYIPVVGNTRNVGASALGSRSPADSSADFDDIPTLEVSTGVSDRRSGAPKTLETLNTGDAARGKFEMRSNMLYDSDDDDDEDGDGLDGILDFLKKPKANEAEAQHAALPAGALFSSLTMTRVTRVMSGSTMVSLLPAGATSRSAWGRRGKQCCAAAESNGGGWRARSRRLCGRYFRR